MVYYISPISTGLDLASSTGDGYTINLQWNKALPSVPSMSVAYHIYYSTDKDKVFDEGVKFISVDGDTQADIFDLMPGQLYHFAVRALEYNPIITDINGLMTTFNVLKVYPESVLVSDITDTDIVIPLLSTETFPSSGVIKIGVELINYTSNDTVGNNLILTSALTQRGFNSSVASFHNTDGYDGTFTWNPFITYILGREETNTVIFPCQASFQYPTYAFTIPDGYHQVTKDILTTDLSGSDALNQNFAAFDYAGWRRTDPVLLLSGECVGSYFGGQQFCADGYGGVGNMLRGLSFQERNNQNQEVLLSLTGEPVCLVRRVWKGITCNCYLPSSEHPDDRCPSCYGTKFVVGWEQFYNPRRSDGKIMVRFSPADDDVKVYEAGLESELFTDCWTLTVPTVKDRDFIVRFDEDGNEEFRYEILSVNRNRTLTQLEGAQKFKVQRIRKTDPIYRVRVFRDTSFLPSDLNTTIGSTTGIPPHSHTIRINEKTTMLSQINQLTGISSGHNHPVINGEVQEVLGHKHDIIL